MPDTNSPKAPIADEDLSAMLIGTDQELPRRKWTCPGDHTIAAYVDGVLGTWKRRWVEFHLAGCQQCRLVVADIVKTQREADLPLPPVELRRRAIGLTERKSAHRPRLWVPVGAIVAIVLVATLTVVVRRPEQRTVLPAPRPSLPLTAKSEPPAVPKATVPEIVRKPRTEELAPTVLSPRPDSVVASTGLHFSWKPFSHARDYEVSVVTSDGDLVWEGQTGKSALQLPSDIALRDGSYFVWITANLADGRTAKSTPVRFLVKR